MIIRKRKRVKRWREIQDVKEQEKTERCLNGKGKKWIKRKCRTLHTRQRAMLTDPSVLHLSKHMKENRKIEELHITC